MPGVFESTCVVNRLFFSVYLLDACFAFIIVDVDAVSILGSMVVHEDSMTV